MNNINVSVYQGYDSDKYLDEKITELKLDYLVLSPHGHKNDMLLSEGDLMISLLEDFIERVKNAEASVPVFIYGVFDRIDERVDVSPYFKALNETGNQIYVSVCKSYPTEKIEDFIKIFKI